MKKGKGKTGKGHARKPPARKTSKGNYPKLNEAVLV